MKSRPLVYALGGESLAAPEDTVTAYWAALGAGAEGLAIGVRISKDRKIICISHDSLLATTGKDLDVITQTAKEIAKLDAGATFRSTVLGADNQPTGQRGKDLPWQGDLPKKRRIVHPTLVDVLGLFARRTKITLMCPQNWTGENLDVLVTSILADLVSMGVQNRVVVAGSTQTCQLVHEASPVTPMALYADNNLSGEDNVFAAQAVGASSLVFDIEVACPG
ncbi:MAG: hypothetical protein JKY92_07385, partial [Magnetovibrio sp.]|nr:hypothetical protein [Magnetovibrio sp.]